MTSKGTLLLIEDDPSDIYLFEEATRDIGINNHIKVCYSGESAIEYIKATNDKTFLILCDMNMPKMTGIELKREIEQTERIHRKCIPFIFLSNGFSKRLLEEAYDLKVQGYFLKGNDYQEYMERLEIIIKYWELCLFPAEEEEQPNQTYFRPPVKDLLYG
jgi:CheY-like chemotaxis protein